MSGDVKQQQSPIDLGDAERVAAVFPSNYLDLHWVGKLEAKPEHAHGHLEFVFENLPEGVGLRLNGHFFQLVKYHFHARSEHRVEGQDWPLELHLVHRDPSSERLAVLGVFVDVGEPREGTRRFFQQATQLCQAGADQTPVAHDPRDLLPVDRGDFYRYEGSLTTKLKEDNAETVSWLVFREPLKVDAETLAQFVCYAHQAKPVQPAHRRFVLCNFLPEWRR